MCPRAPPGPGSAVTSGATGGGGSGVLPRPGTSDTREQGRARDRGLASGCGAERGRRGVRPPASLLRPGVGGARVGSHGRDVPPGRASPIPAGASPSWETRWEPGSSRGCPGTPSPRGARPVTAGFGGPPARCYRPAGPGCWRGGLCRGPGAATLPRAGLAAPPGPSTPCAGTRAAWSVWGSWKSGSGPCPAPRGATAGGREPRPCRRGRCPPPDSLPGPGAVGAGGSGGEDRGARGRSPSLQGEWGVLLADRGCRPPRSPGTAAAAACALQTKGACSSALCIQGRVPRGARSTAAAGRGVCGEGAAPACGAGGPRPRAGKGKGVSALRETVWPLSLLRVGSLPVTESHGGAGVGSVGLLSVPRHRLPRHVGVFCVGQGGHSSDTAVAVTPKTSRSWGRQMDMPVSQLVPTIRAQSERQGWCQGSARGWPGQAGQQAAGFGCQR